MEGKITWLASNAAASVLVSDGLYYKLIIRLQDTVLRLVKL